VKTLPSKISLFRLTVAMGLFLSVVGWFTAGIVGSQIGWAVSYKGHIISTMPAGWFAVLAISPFASMAFAYLLIRSRRDRPFALEDLFVVLFALAPWIHILILCLLWGGDFYYGL